jgi:hypothetical protein
VLKEIYGRKVLEEGSLEEGGSVHKHEGRSSPLIFTKVKIDTEPILTLLMPDIAPVSFHLLLKRPL